MLRNCNVKGRMYQVILILSFGGNIKSPYPKYKLRRFSVERSTEPRWHVSFPRWLNNDKNNSFLGFVFEISCIFIEFRNRIKKNEERRSCHEVLFKLTNRRGCVETPDLLSYRRLERRIYVAWTIVVERGNHWNSKSRKVASKERETVWARAPKTVLC